MARGFRPLVAADFGLSPDDFRALDGTVVFVGRSATVRIRMIVGRVGNPFRALRSLAAMARAGGATVLVIEGSLAEPRLFDVLKKRYGLVSHGGIDRIVIPLKAQGSTQ